MDPELPKTLSEAMATEPLWLRSWINLLIATNLAAVLFVVGKPDGRWRIRLEPIAILISFFAAAALMGRIYEEAGYVRLLGLAHLVCWGPVWAWIFLRRREPGSKTLFARYLLVYLVVAGLSLLVDALDVLRYSFGDGELLGRWSGS